MSELKEHLFCECDECIREYRGQLSNEMRPYYLKSEADKVIAELIEKNKRLANKDKIMASETIKDMYDELRHNKYKRCLAMAMWCEEVDLFGGYTSNYWMRWRNKWLELAEKFKEG